MSTPDYAQQLADKAARLQTLFTGLDTPDLEILPSPPSHYRMRAEFRIWHEGDNISYAMFEPGRKAGSASLIKLADFPAASPAINRLMPVLLQAVAAVPVLQNRWYQCEFLSTLSGEVLVSMIYHKKLDDAWQTAARELRAALHAAGHAVELIGRAHKQKVVLDRDYVIERLQVAGRELQYMQVENSFTQPNAGMNQQMLAWALEVTQGAEGDLLELYCGNGNFSLALARNFRKVLATEIAKPSVDSAQYNIQANDIQNVKILRMSAEEFTMAIRGERVFNRLKGIDLTSYQCNTIFVDPPRAGLDQATLDMVQGYERILYVSCNPLTLRDNLQQLTQTHDIKQLALFDQFPYTEHMESGVLLVRR